MGEKRQRPTWLCRQLEQQDAKIAELRRQLEQELQLPLPATLAFEYPTVEALADYLLQEALALTEPQTVTTTPAAQHRDINLAEPIAVVSLACRFPGADTPEAFWQLLCQGKAAITEIPGDRWSMEAYYHPNRAAPGKMTIGPGMEAPAVIEQIKAQLDRLVPVLRVVDLTEEGPHVARELALIKVAGQGEPRVEALRLADVFRARVVDATTESFVFEMTGAPEKIDAFVELMRPLGLIELARTGVAAIARGASGLS